MAALKMFKLVILVCVTSIIKKNNNCTEQDIVVSDWRLIFTVNTS